MPMKKLRRSSENKVFAGVLGGIGEYFDVDPVLLRVGFIFFVLATGIFPGVIAYILAIFVMPSAASPVIHEAPQENTTEDHKEG